MLAALDFSPLSSLTVTRPRGAIRHRADSGHDWIPEDMPDVLGLEDLEEDVGA